MIGSPPRSRISSAPGPFSPTTAQPGSADFVPLPYQLNACSCAHAAAGSPRGRTSRSSEEHTPQLQPPDHLVFRLLLATKKQTRHPVRPLAPPDDNHTRPILRARLRASPFCLTLSGIVDILRLALFLFHAPSPAETPTLPLPAPLPILTAQPATAASAPLPYQLNASSSAHAATRPPRGRTSR